MTATDCLELRPRLVEYALSTLPERDRREVERHLEWCAGCRKECRELQEGAAIAGLSLPPAEPPAQLEREVAARIRGAVPGARPGRRRTRLMRSATILAAVIGLLGIGVGGTMLARQQTTNEALKFSQQQAKHMAHKLDALLRELGTSGVPSLVDQADLSPPAKRSGTGGVVRVSPTSSRYATEIIVLVGGLDRSGAPYRVWLLGPRGQRFRIPGYMALDPAGGGELPWSGRDLDGYDRIEVRDVHGRLALSGSFTAAAPQ